jgi:hypothetical protein
MYSKQIYYEDGDCTITLEEFEKETFVHLTLYKATKEILERVLKVFSEIKAEFYWLGYEAIYTYTQDKRMFKFFPFAEVIGDFYYHGKKYKVGKWVLN